MANVDEALLSKLVSMYGLENESSSSQKLKLWNKVTKDYNKVTGNMHTRTKLNKKWQNMKHTQRVMKKDLYKEMVNAGDFAPGDSQTALETKYALTESGENLWNVMDHALRDLFYYLVSKHNVEGVSNPRQKNEVWKAVSRDFHQLVGNAVVVKHEKFTKKWQNLKQYNRQRGKPHPLDAPDAVLDFDIVKEKVRKLRERASFDRTFAAFLARESDSAPAKLGPPGSDAPAADAAGRTSGSGDVALSTKQLEREVYLEALRCEQERYRTIVETGRLEAEKLRRETDWMDVQLQAAQVELALKRQECHEKGIILQ